MNRENGVRGNGRDLLLIGLLTILSLVIMAAGSSIIMIVRGVDVAQQTHFMRLFQMLSTLFIFLLPVAGWLWIRKKSWGETMRFGRLKGPLLLLALIFPIVATPLVMSLSALNELLPLPEWALALERSAETAVEQMLAVSDWATLLFNLLVVAVVPAVCEEIFFRGAIQPIFCRVAGNSHLGIWITALIFSLIHMQLEGLLPRLALGALLGYMYHYSRSLSMPILAHGMNNALGVLSYFAATRLEMETEVESSMIFDHWYLLVLSIIGVALMLRTLIRLSAKPAA